MYGFVLFDYMMELEELNMSWDLYELLVIVVGSSLMLPGFY